MIEFRETQVALDLETARLQEVSVDPRRWYLWFWEAPRGLVVPRNLAVKPAFDAAAHASANRGWSVHVRSTGGDVTPMGPGVVSVSVVCARTELGPMSIEGEYDKLCAPIERTLGPGGARGFLKNAFCDGAYNVQYKGLKFAGTAMRFRPLRHDKSRFAVLSHALMLMTPPDQEAIDALNAFLADMSEPRIIERHVHTGLPKEARRDAFIQQLKRAYLEQYGFE